MTDSLQTDFSPNQPLSLSVVRYACTLFLCACLASLLTDAAKAQDGNPCMQIEQLRSAEISDIDALGQQCAKALPGMSAANQDRHIRFYLREMSDYFESDKILPLAETLTPNARRMLLSYAAVDQGIKGNLDMAEAGRLIRASGNANDLVALSHLHFAKGAQLNRIGAPSDSVERHLQASLRLAEKSNLVKKYPRILNALGMRARSDGEFDLAIDLYQQALEGYESIGRFEDTGAALSNIGNIFNNIGGSKEAIRFHKRALESFEQFDGATSFQYASVYTNLGTAYKMNSQYELSHQAYLRAKEYHNPGEIDFLRGHVELNHAETLYRLGKIDAAIAMLEMAAPKVFELGEPVEGANGLLRLAGYYLEKDEITKAQNALNLARTALEPNGGGVEEVENFSSGAFLKGTYSKLTADLLTRLGRSTEAAPYFQAASRYSDIRFEEEKMKAVANSEVLFEIRERDSRLEKLEAEAALASSELYQSRLAIALALVVSLLIGTLAYASFRSYRMQKAMVKTRDIFLQEIHHRTGNNFQMMSSLLRSEERSRARDKKAAVDTNNTANRIHAMGLIHKYLYNSDAALITGVRPETFLVELLDLLDQGLGRDGIDLTHEITPCEIDVSVATPLALLVCEFVTNAYKHAFPDGKGTIAVTLSKIGDDLRLIVADDGYGFDVKAAHNKPDSEGMHLIEDLTDQIGGKLDLASSPKGTTWTIYGIEAVRQLPNSIQHREAA